MQDLRKGSYRLRTELKAIDEWELSAALLRTRTERDAISSRAVRRLVIKRLFARVRIDNVQECLESGRW